MRPKKTLRARSLCSWMLKHHECRAGTGSLLAPSSPSDQIRTGNHSFPRKSNHRAGRHLCQGALSGVVSYQRRIRGMTSVRFDSRDETRTERRWRFTGRRKEGSSSKEELPARSQSRPVNHGRQQKQPFLIQRGGTPRNGFRQPVPCVGDDNLVQDRFRRGDGPVCVLFFADVEEPEINFRPLHSSRLFVHSSWPFRRFSAPSGDLFSTGFSGTGIACHQENFVGPPGGSR